MKKSTAIIRAKKIAILFLTSAILFSFSSCAKRSAFQTSTVVPAARGDVKVKKDNNHNFIIHVTLLDLAEPNRLTPAKSVYVVWAVTEDNITKNLGQIKTSTSLFSSALKGEFKTVSAFKPSKVFVTAEDESAVQFPSTFEVLSTNNF